MADINITTNHVPRELVALADAPERVRKEFDYITGEDAFYPRLFAYRGSWYDKREFEAIRDQPAYAPLRGWDGVQSDSFFSGLVIRYTDDFETVVVGRYSS